MELENTYPLLSKHAVDTLVIPGSSAPIERTFSTAAEATSGKRNRLSDKNLEREVLMQKNKCICDCSMTKCSLISAVFLLLLLLLLLFFP